MFPNVNDRQLNLLLINLSMKWKTADSLKKQEACNLCCILELSAAREIVALKREEQMFMFVEV